MSLRNAFGDLALDSTVQSIDEKTPELIDGAVPVAAESLPLPDGAATESAQTTGNTSLSSIDGKLPALVDGAVPVDGPLTDAELRAEAVLVSAESLPLPDGAATAAKQDTGNTSLSSIDNKLPALINNRVPVDIGSPSINIGASVEVSNDAGNPLPVSDGGGSLTVDDGGSSLTVDGTVGISGTVAISASSLPLPGGAATSANQSTANTSLASIDGKTPALINGRQPVDGSGVTQPISAAALPLPTGAATSALQTTGNTSLSSIDGKLPTLQSGNVPVLVQNGQLEIANDVGNPIPMGPAAMVAFSGSGSALNTDLFSGDVSAYRGVSFQILGTFVGTVVFQASNDNLNWIGMGFFNIGGTTSLVAAATASGGWYGPLGGFSYFRLRISAYTSGTINASGNLLKESPVSSINTTGTFTSINASATSASTVFYTINSAATTNGANIKSSGANFYGLSAMNTSASTKYIRLFNLATAPTVGTSVPIMVVAIPATSSKEMQFVPALRFGTGLAVAITGGASATDSTAVAAGDVQLLVSYA